MLRLSKTELKRQKDILKRYQRYLPMLQLKQQQLQISIQQVMNEKEQVETERQSFIASIRQWHAVFGENKHLSKPIESILILKSVETGKGNIAGVTIPLFHECTFERSTYDIFSSPFWLEAGIDAVEQIVTIDVRIRILDIQIEKLADELRRTTQRVNLFEKVLIPQTEDKIRRIRITLSDQQTAAVVRGKMCKKKIVGVLQ